MLGFKCDIEYLYNISPSVQCNFSRPLSSWLTLRWNKPTMETNYVVGHQGCQIDTSQKTTIQIILFKLYILTKLCLHSHHINKYLINGLLTNLQELLKNHYFSTCFHACNTVSCRHNLLTNCEMLVWRLQSFSIVLNKIRITFTASNWYFEHY